MYTIESLQNEYKELVDCKLPAVAVNKFLPVQLNHCFSRIILDAVCGGCWYNFLARGTRIPAYKQLSVTQLKEAIAIGQSILTQPPSYTIDLNNQSLNWRKLK